MNGLGGRKPENVLAVGGEWGIDGEEGEAFELGLGDEHALEGIGLVEGELGGGVRRIGARCLAASDDQGHAVQGEMPIGGPTGTNAQVAHDGEPVRVGQGELLIGKFPDEFAGFGQFDAIESTDV